MCPETPCSYPICLPRSAIDAIDLRSYHRDLIQRAAELFVADETACSLELRELWAETSAGCAKNGSGAIVKAQTRPAEGSATASRTIPTADSLQEVLGERQVTFQKPIAEFEFDFNFNQSAQGLRRKLYRMKTVLEGTLRTLSAIHSQAKEIEKQRNVTPELHDLFLRELDSISRDLKSHCSTAEELLNISADIKSTIHSIINFKNQDILNHNEVQLKVIAEKSVSDSESVKLLSELSYKDSRTMRITSVIALIYLPTNLVLTFFSTSFIEMLGSVNSNDENAAPRKDAQLEI
ncbi:hypothetical protein G7Z17_g4179 [Cylindrodendrum hubeiense]|uniref:Uncharacterized protein n=1 Tax=Cylindrodendrum hubeiense TaxID=595255 RepID=A0A9P5HEG2_9HYPO|nr:hypothetical protein G7Z17_g4179 [Cylindrodendrum hubeiense]